MTNIRRPRHRAPASEKRLARRLLVRWLRWGMGRRRMALAIRRRFGVA